MESCNSRRAALNLLRLEETPDTKLCNACEKILPSNSFTVSNSSHDRKGLKGMCKECTKTDRAKYGSEYARNINYRTKYGITTAQYDELLASQGGCCKLCGSFEAGGRHNRFVIDHDHEDGSIRGILCNKCNVGLGSFRDTPATLRAAAKYLEDHRGTYGANNQDN